MTQLITPRTLKGFRDYPPALMIPRERMLEQARATFRSYGFAPIDTPALEYTEILMGKGGEESDKLIYRFRDHGDRDVALRFDLTVPFARFAAQYVGELGTPFKRYAMGPVWRGENTAAGRYREFWQCDFDVIGTTSNAADVEIALVINDLFVALGFDRFEVRVNNRLVLNGLIEVLIGETGKLVPILRSLDKFDKIGRDAVRGELMEQADNRACLSYGQAEAVLDVTTGFKGLSNVEILQALHKNSTGNEVATRGVKALTDLIRVASEAGVPEARIRLDPSICRGLDYYTGTIYETFLLDLPKIGSVCSGGRYDNLACLYTKQQLPGVGASLGLDRLLAAMEELKLLPTASTPAPVLVVLFDAARLGDYQRIGRVLRAAGVGAEVYPDAKKIGQQLAYADKRGFRLALIAGENEFGRGVWQLKNLAAGRTQEKVEVAEADLVGAVKAALA